LPLLHCSYYVVTLNEAIEPATLEDVTNSAFSGVHISTAGLFGEFAGTLVSSSIKYQISKQSKLDCDKPVLLPACSN
jgi:hypothetical protein